MDEFGSADTDLFGISCCGHRAICGRIWSSEKYGGEKLAAQWPQLKVREAVKHVVLRVFCTRSLLFWCDFIFSAPQAYTSVWKYKQKWTRPWQPFLGSRDVVCISHKRAAVSFFFFSRPYIRIFYIRPTWVASPWKRKWGRRKGKRERKGEEEEKRYLLFALSKRPKSQVPKSAKET